MREQTANDKKQQGRRSAYEPSPEDVVGMLEAGLEELSRHYRFEAKNVAGGVVLTISGVQRVDDTNGTWHLSPATSPADASGEGTVEDGK